MPEFELKAMPEWALPDLDPNAGPAFDLMNMLTPEQQVTYRLFMRLPALAVHAIKKVDKFSEITTRKCMVQPLRMSGLTYGGSSLWIGMSLMHNDVLWAYRQHLHDEFRKEINLALREFPHDVRPDYDLVITFTQGIGCTVGKSGLVEAEW